MTPMTARRPTTDAGRAGYVLERLPEIVRKHRGSLSRRAAAREIGINYETLNRLERGEDSSTRTLLKVFAWLDGSVWLDKRPVERRKRDRAAKIEALREEGKNWTEADALTRDMT